MLLSAALMFVMQAGFLCLESGLVRSKNSINVAAKNLSDFALSSAVFWLFGFGIMFGESYSGWFGTSGFVFGDNAQPMLIAIFLFQMMFCGTAATLVSGAVAERMNFFGYLMITLTLTLLIYPLVGHWAWAGHLIGEKVGWLEIIGFVDFAGSTVVHSVGGWVALAAVLVIGPRIGRYEVKGKRIPASNLPMATLGGMFIWFGWFGFNGGSALTWNDAVPGILLNTSLAAVWGGIGAVGLKYVRHVYVDVVLLINGVIGGLVAVTASCHVVSPGQAAIIGLIGGMIVVLGGRFLDNLRIDDGVGVLPVHLFAGIWGTLAVAIFAEPDALGTGLSSMGQLKAQLIGITSVGLFSFFVPYAIFKFINALYPLRVSEELEHKGLNIAEHRVSTETFDLLTAMNRQQKDSEFSTRVPAEPFTEVGQIAEQYNRVIDKVNDEIQQRDSAFLAFKYSEYRNGAILDAAMDCIITTNDRGEILEFNTAAEHCFGVSKRHVKNQVFFRLFMEEDDCNIALQSLSQRFTTGESLILKHRNIVGLVRYDHEKFPAELVATKTTDDGYARVEYTLHVRDITQQIKLQNRLQSLAYNDPLTGLYNRTYFMENLEQRIKYHKDVPGLVALMFLDLDQFKKINDTLGHKVGDELLCEVADRLTDIVRGVDLVGRWGGDEFVIVLSGNLTVDSITNKAEEILNVMHQSVELAQQKLVVLTSIGIAISNNGDIDAGRLLQHADLAMYNAKHHGRNTYRLFSSEMEEMARESFKYEVALPEALRDNQFYLHYQPKVDCKTGEIIGFEALIRWEHPEYGLVSPADFIPVIDDSDLIDDVGEWVLTETIKQLSKWQETEQPLLPVAVNISGHHLHSPKLFPFIENLLREYDIPGHLLELEITEGVLTSDTEESIAALNKLKKMNLKLSVDDFGTGYSSLSYLKKFPVDILKIDRTFIIECASNKEDGAICIAVIALAKSLGLETVAEGVETEEQLEFLKQHGCDIYQGYYFSRPIAQEFVPELWQKKSR